MLCQLLCDVIMILQYQQWMCYRRFCIDCFVANESIRLIDITRHIAKPPDALTCLSLHLVIDGNSQPKLLLSTREHSAPDNPEADLASSDTVVLDMGILKEQESLWHCLTISLVSLNCPVQYKLILFLIVCLCCDREKRWSSRATATSTWTERTWGSTS